MKYTHKSQKLIIKQFQICILLNNFKYSKEKEKNNSKLVEFIYLFKSIRK